MNIVFVCHTGTGGHLRYTAEVAHALLPAADVTVLTDANSPGLRTARVPIHNCLPAPNTKLSGVRKLFNRVSVYLRQPGAIRRSLREQYKAGATNTAHFQELPSIMPGRAIRLARRESFRTVVTIHNTSPHDPRLVQRVKSYWARRAWSRSDGLVVHTDEMASEVRSQCGKNGPPVTVVPHLVWEVPSTDLSAAETSVRDFLFFGHLRSSKGLQYFLEALALIGDPTASVIGSASDSDAEAAYAIAERLGLRNCVFDVRFVAESEIASIFARHRIVVTPYIRFAAQSGVTHLAVAHNRPIVATRVGGLAQLVDDYELGETCDAADSEQLGKAMNRALRKAASRCYDMGLAKARHNLHGSQLIEQIMRPYER